MALYAFDGTGQKDDHPELEDDADTNIARFFIAYRPSDAHLAVEDRHNHYERAIGSEALFRKGLAGITGFGGRTLVQRALQKLGDNLERHDAVIDVVGFSRGAALALTFVNAIASGRVTLADGTIPIVRFVGLFDCVPSFGVPVIPLHIGSDLDLPPNVERCFHAMALDERRGNFHLHRPTVLGGMPGDRLTEVWFRGVHSDIGGPGQKTVPPRGLASIPLNWMFIEAQACGLSFDSDLVASNEAQIRPDARMLDNFDPIETAFRRARDTDLIHHTVKSRDGLNTPTSGLYVPDREESLGVRRTRDDKRELQFQDTERVDSGLKTRQAATIRVWFGTNRLAHISSGLVSGFGTDRAETVSYGHCDVHVPEGHKIGSTGSAWWRRLLSGTDDRLVLKGVSLLAREAYWRAVSRQLTECQAGERDAVVFLHGYNVSFMDAAIRTAQIGFDLAITGVMAFYSWPSKGELKGYPADEASVEASEDFIAQYLTDIATLSGAEKVHVIAHSMGNRGLLRALDRIASTAAERSKKPFSQIVLAAADVDQDTFRRLSVAYARVAERTTMYVCGKDRAVEASYWLHQYPRAGLIPPVLIVPDIDTVSVSNLDLTLLGHGYVAEARELLTDMYDLIRNGNPPSRRFGLRQAQGPEGSYWIMGK